MLVRYFQLQFLHDNPYSNGFHDDGEDVMKKNFSMDDGCFSCQQWTPLPGVHFLDVYIKKKMSTTFFLKNPNKRQNMIANF